MASRGTPPATKATKSQSTDTRSTGGQNKPDPGGTAGQGRSPGKAQPALSKFTQRRRTLST